MNAYSLIPPTKYGDKDPQSLLYLNPSIPAQKLAKMYNKYIFFKTIATGGRYGGKWVIFYYLMIVCIGREDSNLGTIGMLR